MKQQKNKLKKTLLVAALILITFLLMLVFYYALKKSNQFNSTYSFKDSIIIHSQKNNRAGIPIRLTIPNLKVDAIIDQVGLTTDGAMDVPLTPTSTAWYNLGPLPGEIGSAVIDGHFGWGNGIAAVFDNLYQLKPGDKLYIKDDNKNTTTFIVRELKTYDQNDYAKDVFYSTDNKPHLNLITCKGVWSKTDKSYSERLVVFTDKE